MARGESYLRILNQPTNRMRFRYGSEKGSHGVLTGKHSSQKRKNYPTVKLENYFGTQPVFIKATLYTNDDTPRQHVHKLKGPNCEDGICTIKADETNTAIFQNLSIEFVGKREVSKIIFERKRKELQFESLQHDIERIKEISNEESKAINLHVVKICFEAGIFESGNRWQLISKVYSDPIANQKCIDTGELKITRMDKYSGSCKGGDEVFLLCERVNKKDIEIRFFEEKDGKQIWEAKGHFTDSDVHHQVAIVFKTPAYQYEDINKSVRVLIQLFRPSDQETSRPIPFEYKPQVQDMSPNAKKRKKESNVEFRDSDFSSFTITQDIPDITNISYDDDEHKNSSGDKRNIEKSVLSCSDLNFDDVIKSSHSLSNPSSINTKCFPEIATKKITDIFGKNKEQQFIPQENNWLAKDLNEGLSSIFYDIDMTDEMWDYILKDSSRDPLLASTSSFYNPPLIKSGLYADSVIEEISPNSLIDGISNLNLEENLPKNNHSKQIFQDKNENILNKYFLWIVKAFQDFIKTGNIFYIFSSMHLMINIPYEERNNILHLAIIHQSRNLQLLKCLFTIAKVIPEDIINHVNISKQTVLHLAAKYGSPTIHNFLDAGCNPNHKDINGCTVVHYAVLYNNIDCLNELVKFQQKYEVDFNILNFEGLSPLHLAVKNGHDNIVKILCKGDLNINITDGKTGRTALHYAVEFCPSLAKILLNQSEIIADLQDYNGTTPLNLAYHYDHQEIIKILNTENSVSLIENVRYDEYESESEESSFSNNDETFENSNSNSKIISADNIESTREFSQEKINYNIDSEFQNREIPFLENSILKKICELLDPPNEEWKTLAEYLIDKPFIEIAEKYSSPTKTLLKTYMGTLEEFRAYVALAGLNHVLELLN